MADGKIISVRKQEVREVRSHTVRIGSPLERIYVIPGRNNNIFGCIAETVWVLAGRNDLGYLSHYLPRAADFSDDGQVWRAGYGPRLRDWNGVDQVGEVVRILLEDPTSRRAAMSLFDPARDFGTSKDIPCNNWLHFMIRDGLLHMSASVRSNDVMWGFSGINTFELSVLQEAIAYWTGTQVGEFSYFIASFHLYKHHYRRAHRIIETWNGRTLYEFGIPSLPFTTKWYDLSILLSEWFKIEAEMRVSDGDMSTRANEISDPFLRGSLLMLNIYNRYLCGANKAEIANLTQALPPSDFRVAAIEFFAREWDDPGFIRLSAQETAFFDGFWAQQAPPGLLETIISLLCLLHDKKSRVYRDSWKKHGEVIGVFANIARKFDRLEIAVDGGVAGLSDEGLADTLADISIYAVKYLTYLADHYPTVTAAFFNSYKSSTDIREYQQNDGFDTVIKALEVRYRASGTLNEHRTREEYVSLIRFAYAQLENLLLNEDWRSADPRKCTLAADIAIASIHGLVIEANADPSGFNRFVMAVRAL